MQKIKFPKPCSSWLILFINLSFVFNNLKIAVKSLFFKVSTIFWWDNFDRNIETVSGAGSVHSTPGVVFQENSAAAVMRHEDVSIPRSKRRSIQLSTENVDKRVAINPKAEPPSFAGLHRASHLLLMQNNCVLSCCCYGNQRDISTQPIKPTRDS